MNKVIILLISSIFISCHSIGNGSTTEDKIFESFSLYENKYPSKEGFIIVKILPDSKNSLLKLVITRLYNNFSLSKIDHNTTYYLKRENKPFLVIDEKNLLNYMINITELNTEEVELIQSKLKTVDDGLITYSPNVLYVQFSNAERSERELETPISPIYQFNF